MLLILFGILGVLVGILINRAADNLPPPARRSLFAAPHCPYCDAPRSAIEQFGLLAFILRRDKCHACGAPLRLRLPLVELATAALFIFLALRYSVGFYGLALMLFTPILLLIIVIDLEHKLILNVVVLPATVLALLLSPIMLAAPGVTLETLNLRLVTLSLLGAAVGYIVTYGIYLLGILFLKMVNRNRSAKINTVAFGMGDVKLAGFLGALVGFPTIFYVLILTILLGGLGALLAIAWQFVRRHGYGGFMAIPYGPYFVIAAWLLLIWR